jgi:asparagine synthase (glutamine-hydrolysing)
MCGIAGSFGGGDATPVRTMLERLHHRGPDDQHVIAGRDFVMGACRLSIQDPANGRQPLENEDGSVVAMQNGEIYNAPELRDLLREKGHRILTRCDTEVLPHLYEDHGTELASRIDGMFAVAVWDRKNRRGLLVRDRIGKKPLYYLPFRGVLYFASEIKALLAVPGFQPTLDPEAVWHYLGYKHVPGPMTVYREIRQLPPAHLLIWEDGAVRKTERYWNLKFSTRTGDLDEEELVDELLGHLKKAVRRRLNADVPVGCYLSGGIDSSLTTVLAAEMAEQPLHTFTLAYEPEASTPGKEEDCRWARRIASDYGTKHHEVRIGSRDIVAALPRILDHFDQPFAGVISTYFVTEDMAGHVKVAISGDGADELFGSYLSHRLALPLSRYADYARTGDASLIPGYAQSPDELARWHAEHDWVWRAKLLVFQDEEKRSLLAPEFSKGTEKFSTAAHLKDSFAGLTAGDPLNRMLEMEFHTQLPDQVLTFVDRLSMAHSLEVRCPFLDTALVEFAASLPGDWKIRNGCTKHLLKRAALRYFPEEMVNRKKEGFVIPPSPDLLKALLGMPVAEKSEDAMIDPAAWSRLAGLAERTREVSVPAFNKLYTASLLRMWSGFNR